MPLSVLQLRAGEAVQGGSVQGLPGGDARGLRER